jgi:hypothetical protein
MSVMKKSRRMFALASVAAMPFLAQSCEPTLAGTTDKDLAACRILYQSVDGNGDAHMFNGGCIVPRPQVSNDIRLIACLRPMNATWGVQAEHRAKCDNPVGTG